MPLIVLEGIDGAGKSCLMDALQKALRERKLTVASFREPGSTPVGEGVRRLLLDPNTGPLSPWTEVHLFTACRAELVACFVKPALAAGGWVLLDRYFYSTMAYQGSGSGLDPNRIKALNLQAVEGLVPERVLLLDLPAELARSRQGAEEDRLESRHREHLERVRRGYLRQAAGDPARMIVLDARQPQERLLQAALSALQPLLGAGS